MSQQCKFFPGWLVVASGFVIMATCYTIFVNCMSLFQPLIVSDLGITLAQCNISNAISTVVSVIGSLVIGHVADKVSGRVLGSLTVIATSAVLAGMSFVGELWQVYVLFAVASTRLLISLVTANWFTAKRGLAISIALSGSGFGGAILSPIVSSLIVGVGWRSAFLVLAAICMVAALPITAYSFRTKPSEIGLKPLGENPGDPSVSTVGDKDEHTAPEVSVGWSRIKKSPALAACRRLPLYGAR
ncbi:MAG: MFS transporter [Collinsella sp.]|nr:MFS transporter [Collinsella sp.]